MTEALFDPGPFGARPQLFADERYAAEEIPAPPAEAYDNVIAFTGAWLDKLPCPGCEARPCRCAEYGTEAITLAEWDGEPF